VRGNIVKARLHYQSTLNTANSSILFIDLMNVKADNNNNSNHLLKKKLGKKKLELLIEAGIASGCELPNYRGMHHHWNGNRHTRNAFYGWSDMVKRQFEHWEQEAKRAKVELVNLEELVRVNTEALEVEKLVLGGFLDNDPLEDTGRDAATEEETIPYPLGFSKMKDVKGYNARILSASRMESLLMTDFMSGKKLMQSRMMSQPSQTCKLDFSYKIPGKVNVHKGMGDCFKPFRSMFVLQNKKKQTVYWKCLAGSELIASFKKGLERFRDANPEIVKATWCDNCCSIRNTLQKIFPDAIILLDIFHWTKRWDLLLCDTKSEEAAIFRGLIKRATFLLPPDEHKSAKL